ncbi:unnamed protein product [Effrenium voratum]|uniref:Uncharacterized protein n=1 Tax=Effrenium voratum TaxID=2562239 RepID=A0AA36J4J0_9DINO|nr:unnamed protein product [Effrenium voratum]
MAANGSLESWRVPGQATEAPAKRRRERPMHGVTISDHGEKTTWPGYWEERQRKLESQAVDGALFGALASRLSAHDSDAAASASIFRSCCIYFDGRVDVGGGLSAYALSKVARLHGAQVSPMLAKRRVTHVVCTQLSGAKERHALHDATSAFACVQYIVHPNWITESIAAGLRLKESQFSLMAGISQTFGQSIFHCEKRKAPNASAAQAPEAPGEKLLTRRVLAEITAPLVVPDTQNSREAELVDLSDSPPKPAAQEVPATALDSSQETELDSDEECQNSPPLVSERGQKYRAFETASGPFQRTFFAEIARMAAVVLRGLESKPKLNGREVNLVAFHPERQRWEVELKGEMPHQDLFKIDWSEDWWEPMEGDEKYSSLRKEKGPTFKEVLEQKLQKQRLTDTKSILVADCNGRRVAVFDGQGELLTVLSGKHVPRKVETDCEVCQRSFPLQFQKLAPEGRTLAVKPSCLRTKEDNEVETLRRRKVEMTVGAIHKKPELDGQVGLLGAFQGYANCWEVMPDAKALWDVKVDGSPAPVLLHSKELSDEASGKVLEDPVEVKCSRPEQGQGLFAKVAIRQGEIILEDEPCLLAAFSLDVTKLIHQFNQLPVSKQDGLLQLSKGPDSLMSLRCLASTSLQVHSRSDAQQVTKDALLASQEFRQLSQSLQDQIWNLMRIFDSNALPHSRSEGKILYPTLARVNHSCRPKATLGDPQQVVSSKTPGFEPIDPLRKALIAIEDIEEGGEITISYLSDDDLLEPTQHRRVKLQSRYGFQCQCARCLDEESDKVLRVFRCSCGKELQGVGPCACGADVSKLVEAEQMHVSSFANLWKSLGHEKLSSPDGLVAIAEMAAESNLAPQHWLLCKVRYVLSCFYEKNHRPALAVENLQGILDLEEAVFGHQSQEKLEQRGDQLVQKGALTQAFDCYAAALKALKQQSPNNPPGDARCDLIRQKLRSVLDAKKDEGYPAN